VSIQQWRTPDPSLGPGTSDVAATRSRLAVRRLLGAIESRDLRRIGAALTEDAEWCNVPHPPARGRDAVIDTLAPIVCWSDLVRWEVVTASYAESVAWVERVDRFVIDGEERAVSCNGVFTISPSGAVASVRDYVDLGEWRARIAPVYERMASRRAVDVVARHLAAVERRDPVAMATDYAADARVERGRDVLAGRAEIAGYFDAIPPRLAGKHLDLSPPREDGADHVLVDWSVVDADRAVVASGRDRYLVARGWIVEQVVSLDTSDF
jgi:limonene-1,2-epoxide hydrolase